MALKAVLVMIGIATVVAAVLGLARGHVYCKGGPYSRATQPVVFWLSIAVYCLWSALMMYFAFFTRE
ncbi:MAG: hypothetical protein KF693_04920 [Nitrospira sp.]|nr:hypothetical protein [Nitrospira sp.]